MKLSHPKNSLVLDKIKIYVYLEMCGKYMGIDSKLEDYFCL